MTDVTITKLNEVFAKVSASPEILSEFSESLTFESPGYQYSPAYKSGRWDGKIRLLNYRTSCLNGGLVPHAVVLADNLGYTINVDPQYKPKSIDKDLIQRQVEDLNLPEFIDLQDFQYNSIFEALSRSRCLIVSPTSSGKSLIIHILSMLWGGRSLIIVPTVLLANQMAKNIKEFCPDRKVHIVAEGSDKENRDADVTVSTWQAIYKQPAGYFTQYDNVFGDEVHKFEAKSCREMMEKMPTVVNRAGLTGSLKGSKTHELILTGLFGSKFVCTTTRELIDRKFVSDVQIICLVFAHPKETQQLLGNKHTYPEEKEVILSSELRNKYIKNLISTLDGNVLGLYRKIDKHGELLRPLIEELGRAVHYINGRASTKKAKLEVADLVEQATNDIILASSGVFSTGVSINNIQYMILMDAIKSIIDLLQSLGRGLRKDGKADKLIMFDLADKLRRKGDKSNPFGYSYRHFVERLGIYAEQQLDYKIIEVELK